MEHSDVTNDLKFGNTREDGPRSGGLSNARGNLPSQQGTRKRVSQACAKCRMRKDKCDGKKPICSTCQTHGRNCTYDANVKKRGLPEGYVRGLEKLWGLGLKEVVGLEENVLAVFNGGEKNEWLSNIWRNDDDSLAETWRKSQLARELERLLPLLEPGSGAEIKRKRADSDVHGGRRSRLDGSQMHLQAAKVPEYFRPDDKQSDVQNVLSAPGAGVNRVGDIEQAPIRVYGSILSPRSPFEAVSGQIPRTVLELPSETWHLLDVYFSYTHPWFPIVEKHDLLRISYQYPKTGGNANKSSGDHAVLWAAISYGKYQHRAINNIPHATGPASSVVWTAERMYAHARSLVPNEEGLLEVSHVQALLILVLTNLGCGHLSRAWLLTGQAIRLAIDLGLDKRLDEQPMTSKPNSRAKHIFLACFALDTIISSRLGYRPHLRSEDVDAIGMVIEDGLEEWDPWTDCLAVRKNSNSPRGPAGIPSTFNRLIQVFQILNDATHARKNPEGPNISTGLLEKLHNWSQAQTEPLYFDSSAVESNKDVPLLPHQYHLHIAYFSTLAACQLLSYGRRKSSPDLEPCARSAQHVVGLLRRYKSSFGLLIVPPTFECCTKIVYDVVHAIRSSIENTHIVLDSWKHNLDHYVSVMESAWIAFEVFKSSIDQPTSRPRRQSEVAFDLMRGLSVPSETPQSAQTPIGNGYDISTAFSPQFFKPQRTATSDALLQNRSNAATFGSHALQTFGASPMQDSPQSIYSLGTNPASNLWDLAHQSQNINPSRPANTIAQPLHSPQFQGSVASADGDPTFNEFAAMDASKWTNSWDQSLVNLGFTDSDNMDSDFHAFCREPDPLYSNSNIFQRLLANSNPEITRFIPHQEAQFGGMMIGEFGGLGFADETEGIEASQILQALSAAEDQRASGRSTE